MQTYWYLLKICDPLSYLYLSVHDFIYLYLRTRYLRVIIKCHHSYSEVPDSCSKYLKHRLFLFCLPWKWKGRGRAVEEGLKYDVGKYFSVGWVEERI